MAVNEAYLQASPEDVWEVLADPYAYPRWVVGSRRTVEADPQWPQPGAEFRPEVGLGPLSYTDRTVCKEVEPGRRIVMHAGGGGVAGAIVDIELEPSGTGTVVKLLETPGGWSAPLRKVPPLQWAIKARNVESLRRLRRLAEARRRRPA
jgi:uncharacterized protein YndB with AHSA1/START domain